MLDKQVDTWARKQVRDQITDGGGGSAHGDGKRLVA